MAWLDPAKALLSWRRLPPFAADRSRHRESFSYAPAPPHRAGPDCLADEPGEHRTRHRRL